MKIQKNQLCAHIETKLKELEPHLSSRVQNVLECLISEDIQTMCDDVEITDLLIRLVLQADKEPVSIIANLLTSLDNEGASQLEEWTISKSGAIVRDYLKKDYILDVLKSKEQKSVRD